jgi:Protein  of unknown function (DUF3018)
MAKSPQQRSVEQYRARMRKAGLRLVQFWVPDTRAPGFAAECRRQSQAAAKKKRLEKETLDWIDATRDSEDWTP